MAENFSCQSLQLAFHAFPKVRILGSLGPKMRSFSKLRNRETAKVITRFCLMGVVCLNLSCTREPSVVDSDVLVVSVEQTSAWTKNFNPLFPGGSRWPTRAGIYEPLMINNSFDGKWIPWLATDFAWQNEGRQLQVKIRENVRWSDGTPFTAKDVAFSFNLLKKHRALDGGNVWRFIESVEVKSSTSAVFSFSKVYSPGFGSLMHQMIVPEHIWSKLKDPVKFVNPKPVGTGPFTELSVFRSQVYELEANPHYWGGKTSVRKLRMPAYGSNDSATLALINGELDWAGHFVPAVDRTFVKRNPKDHHYWFPLIGPMVFLYANTSRPPFDNVQVRKAMSMAIDRTKVVEVAMYGYTIPGNATGLSDIFKSWRNDKLAAQADWIRHDPAAANRLLDEAGYKKAEDGIRKSPTGKRMEFLIEVVSGWSDWVRAAQITSRAFKEIGIDVKMKAYEFSAWFERLQKGNFDLAISWSNKGTTPYDLYKTMASSLTFKPVGELSPTNWHRFTDSEMDDLLKQFEETHEVSEQRRLSELMQKRFVQLVPAIPLFPNPSWGEYNTKRFTGFPNADDPYAELAPFSDFHRLLVMTRLKSRN
jgi:peptide/nickel transport system substrate-binding protein